MRWTGSSAEALAFAALLLAGGAAEGAETSARKIYDQARAAEERLHQSKSRLAKKSEWLKVARMYRAVVVSHPRSGYCDDALFYEAEMYREVHRKFDDAAALKRSLDAYLLLAKGYPSSKWAPRARLTRGKIQIELSERKSGTAELEKVVADFPDSAEALEARRLLDEMTKPRRAAASPERETFPRGIVGVRNIRQWTGTEYTRIVIDLDDEVKYREGSVQDPARIYFDLLGARVTKDLASRPFPVGDGFLQQIRVGQNQADVVRVVLDFQNLSEYNVFTLPDPYRLVVDILGKEPRKAPRQALPVEVGEVAEAGESPSLPLEDIPEPAPAPVVAESKAPPEPGPEPAAAEASPDVIRVPPAPRKDGYSIVQQLGLSASRVVIDPGHGGHDPGTMNKSSLREKDIVLDVSQRLRKLLETDGFEVVMTRDRDVFIPLEERTAIANSKGADLFVSIHVNAARSTKPRGTETYFLNLATTPDAEEVAARENAVTTRRVNELQGILEKVLNNEKITESRELASRVQTSLATDLYATTKDTRNRGVKTAPFYVLLGAQMPSVLVEVAYLTNRQDAALLRDGAFLQKVAESIASGIRRYQDSLARTTRVDASTERVAEKEQPR
jgi:N-acetylmuramoyl-L-alanine amidase